MSLLSLGRLMRTLVDVGPVRLQRRARYELRQQLDQCLPPPLALALAGAARATPAWNPPPLACTPLKPPPQPLAAPQRFAFTFLNESRELPWPIVWNDPSWPRLWQFHLHAFDWVNPWLEAACATGVWTEQAQGLEALLDQWIASNRPGRGDGWHSYTLSLRSRNWLALLRQCPALATAPRLQSLWRQLLWLEAHPEHCHGGNHWLENLTALAIGGLHFAGPRARRMHRRAMGLLQHELAEQILSDGGHQERSTSYHLLMLDRLVALGGVLHDCARPVPAWLSAAITAMTGWARCIRLDRGGAPRFNDSAADAAPPLDRVVEAATRLLQSQGVPSVVVADEVTDLPVTGWTLLRQGAGWELAFKCGVPCPPHLAAHAHSDLLSFDLWHHGRPVLAEAGTSVYGSGPQRQHERSSAGHNTLQLGVGPAGSIDWIEPVEVWGSFRAGRKAQPRARRSGRSGPWLWAAGSHTGYKRISANHHRWLALRLTATAEPVLVVIDQISTRRSLHWRRWFHHGPASDGDHADALEDQGLSWWFWPQPATVAESQTESSSSLAQGFGRRVQRPCVQQQGKLPPGAHALIAVLRPHQLAIAVQLLAPNGGELRLPGLGCIRWSAEATPVVAV
jgi:uncharacterized heparinase superfamily protein